MYKITVPNESSVELRVLVSAEDEPHYAPFSEVAGFARTPWWGKGRAYLVGVSEVDLPIDLSSATMTLTKVLDDSGNELISDLGGPVTLTTTADSTSSAGTFVSEGSGPNVKVTVLNLPLIGQVTSIAVPRAKVGRPSSCGWFGTAMLGTEFSIDDGTNSPIRVSGEDQWTCTPFGLWNF